MDRESPKCFPSEAPALVCQGSNPHCALTKALVLSGQMISLSAPQGLGYARAKREMRNTFLGVPECVLEGERLGAGSHVCPLEFFS